MNPRILIALVLVCVFALAATVLAATDDGGDGALSASSEFQGALMPQGVRAPDFDLVNQDGERVSMRSLRGRPVIVTFLYTHCRDSCPAQAQIVKGALADLDHEVPALAVAVDPPNDTQESARAFLSKQRVAGLDFVLGSRAQLAPLWDGFHIRPQAIQNEHQARFTLVDKHGFQRIGFPGEYATPELLAHDIELLERE
ncbi:MAG TPA: SCO family protein [Thermoleophilaceae bacterium]